jgi:hypothetical protein
MPRIRLLVGLGVVLALGLSLGVSAPLPKKKLGEPFIILTLSDNSVLKLSVDGSKSTILAKPVRGQQLVSAILSPDGTKLGCVTTRNDPKGDYTYCLDVRDVGEDNNPGPSTQLANDENLVRHRLLALKWYPDGKRLFVGLSRTDYNRGGPPTLSHLSWDASIGADGEPNLVEVLDSSYSLLYPDGDSFHAVNTITPTIINANRTYQFCQEAVLMPRDTLCPTVLISSRNNQALLAPFPDGQRWLVQIPDGNQLKLALGTCTVGTEFQEVWAELPRSFMTCYSIDPLGKHVVVCYVTGEVMVVDADGKNSNTIHQGKLRYTDVQWYQP